MKKSIIILLLLFKTGFTFAQETVVKVIAVQRQSVSWGNISRGRASVDSFKKQQLLVLPSGYTIKHAIIYFAGAGFPTVEKINISTTDLQEAQSKILKCVPGSMIVVDKIFVTDPMGKESFLTGAGFALF